MVNPLQKRWAAIASFVLFFGGLWRAGVATQHYLASSRMLDDPSARELEQASAFLELGVALILLGHAAAAAYFTRRRFGLNGVALVAIAAVAGIGVGGSLSRTPVLDTPGLVPVSLLVACGWAGYSAEHPWASAYVGVVLGSVAASLLAALEVDAVVVLAIALPPVVFALTGVGLGRLIRSRAASRRAA